MSSEWPLRYLEDLADEVTVGYVGSMSTEYIDCGVPFLRSLNVNPFLISTNDLKFISSEFHLKLKKSSLKPGDVVIVRTGKPGTCSVIPDWLVDANCSDLVIVRCGPNMRPHFLSYWVNSVATNHISAHLVGAVQQHFNVGAAKKMLVASPSLKTQDYVISILRSLDDRIALLRETNTTLESIAQALFKSWFVDFDPVHANAGTQAPSLPPEIQRLFPSTFVESSLGLAPKGWGVDQCQNLIDVRDGTHASPKESETGFPLITSKHITTGKIRFDDAYLISEVDYVDISRRSAVHHLDVLITMIGTVGIPVFVLNEVTEFAIKNIGLFKTSKRPEFSCFIYLLLKSKDMQNLLESRLAGTTQKYLSLKALREIPLVVPSADVLGKFEEVASSIFKSVYTNNMQVESLISLRDTLLPRLISGQLRLPEVEEMIEESA